MKKIGRVSLLFFMIFVSVFFVACGNSGSKGNYLVTFKIGSNVSQ